MYYDTYHHVICFSCLCTVIRKLIIICGIFCNCTVQRSMRNNISVFSSWLTCSSSRGCDGGLTTCLQTSIFFPIAHVPSRSLSLSSVAFLQNDLLQSFLASICCTITMLYPFFKTEAYGLIFNTVTTAVLFLPVGLQRMYNSKIFQLLCG